MVSNCFVTSRSDSETSQTGFASTIGLRDIVAGYDDTPRSLIKFFNPLGLRAPFCFIFRLQFTLILGGIEKILFKKNLKRNYLLRNCLFLVGEVLVDPFQELHLLREESDPILQPSDLAAHVRPRVLDFDRRSLAGRAPGRDDLGGACVGLAQELAAAGGLRGGCCGCECVSMFVCDGFRGYSPVRGVARVALSSRPRFVRCFCPSRVIPPDAHGSSVSEFLFVYKPVPS